MEYTKEQLAERNIHVFNEYYGITNDQGEKLDFKEHPFLWDIFSDFTPKQAIRKAAQIGFSTTANIKAMWLAKNKKMDIIYSLPTADDVKQFVGGKTNRLIANNPVFQSWTKDKDSIEQKRMGENNIYFKGTWTERAALMIPADLYIADEVDRSKQDVVSAFSSRLQHSKYQWEWHFSNPSAPSVGVDKMWELSDQKHWFVKCDGCNFEWWLTMDNIMGSPAYFGCTKCKKELDRHKGRWVKRWQDKEVSGYWISLLMCPWVPASKILEYKRTKSEDYFANMVLGVPYIGKGNVLTQNLLFQNLVDRINPQDDRPIIGVDTGVDIRYVIGNKYGLFHIGECKDYNDLERLMVRWPTAIMVIDKGGDIIGPIKLKEKFQNRVFSCFYRAERKTDEMITWNDNDCSVVVDRNRCMQNLVDHFTEKRIPLYGKQSDWWDLWVHFSHIYRVSEENQLGVETYKWMRSDRDDYVHACNYWMIGMSRFLESQASFVDPASNFASQGIEVLPNGETYYMPKFR